MEDSSAIGFDSLDRTIAPKKDFEHTVYVDQSDKYYVHENVIRIETYALADGVILVRSDYDVNEHRRRGFKWKRAPGGPTIKPHHTLWTEYKLLDKGRLVKNDKEIKELIQKTTDVSLPATGMYHRFFDLHGREPFGGPCGPADIEYLPTDEEIEEACHHNPTALAYLKNVPKVPLKPIAAENASFH
jgi:hypothetical protein